MPDENPAVVLILCAQKDTVVAHYALENLPNEVVALGGVRDDWCGTDWV